MNDPIGQNLIHYEPDEFMTILLDHLNLSSWPSGEQGAR